MRLIIDRDVPVEMRDGTVLRADVYRPESDAPWPVLLQRTPYDKNVPRISALLLNPVRAASAGYAVMVQDVRGRFASDGEFYTFRHEPDDGYDTIAWAAAQPWSTGKVGMFGLSYVGATQWLAAITTPPALATIVPVVTASDYHEGWTYQGGAFELGFNASWTLEQSGLCQPGAAHEGRRAVSIRIPQRVYSARSTTCAAPLTHSHCVTCPC